MKYELNSETGGTNTECKWLKKKVGTYGCIYDCPFFISEDKDNKNVICELEEKDVKVYKKIRI